MQNDKYRKDFKDAGAFLWARLAERLAVSTRGVKCSLGVPFT